MRDGSISIQKMSPTNYQEHITYSTQSFPDKMLSEKIVKSEGPAYGKICDGAGQYRLSYEGEHPIRNFLIASIISVGRFVLKSAAVVAVPITVTWSLKKMGIISGKDDVTHTGGTHDYQLPVPPSSPNTTRIGKLKDDVREAVEQGYPDNIIASEIYKDSRLIIFSGPGVGKSILVGQLGIGIGSGQPCGVFPDEVETAPQNVLLIDTEQEDSDLYLRYSEGVDDIPETIDRVSECNFNSPEDVAKLVHDKVNSWTSGGTVIIDNLTSAFSLQSGERIRSFFNHLKAIQKAMKAKGIAISYIIVCHETKSAKGLALKDIQGSGNLGNFATSVYGLEKAGEDMMKIKVLKNRRGSNTGMEYLEKLYKEPYFHFKLQKVIVPARDDNETATNVHPVQKPNGRKLSDEQIEEMRRLYREKVMTINQLHKHFGVNNRTVRKYLGLKH